MGCVRSLNGVTRVNPWALEKMSEAIALSLDQSLEERQGKAATAQPGRRGSVLTPHLRIVLFAHCSWQRTTAVASNT